MSQSAVALRQSRTIFEENASVAALKQMLSIGALIGVTWLFAEVHLASIARPVFVAGAIAIAVFYIRRSPWQYLTATLWFWTISPFVRRVVDYYSDYQAVNLVLLTPNIVTLLMLTSILTSQKLLKRPETGTGMLLLGPVLYGLAVSLVKGDIFAGAVASLDWLIPLLFYFYLIDLARRIDEAEAHFRAFIPLNLLIIIGYGFYQFYYPSPWDLKWVDTNNAFAATINNRTELKLFSMLNGPGLCAVWVGTLILLSMHFRTWLSFLVLPPGILFLALTEVRTSVGAVALGLVAAAFFGVERVRRSLVGVIAAVAVALVATSVFDPTVLDRLTARFSTIHNLQNDESALAREDLYRAAPALIAEYPLGQGIGALGKGARIGGSSDMGDFDSGVIAPFVALGWIAGMIYVLGTFTVVAQACLSAKTSRSPAATALAIVAMTCLAEGFFNLVVGLHGMIIWFSVGYASAIGIRAQMSKDS